MRGLSSDALNCGNKNLANEMRYIATELNLVDVVWGDSRKVTGLRDYGKYEALSLMGKNKPP